MIKSKTFGFHSGVQECHIHHNSPQLDYTWFDKHEFTRMETKYSQLKSSYFGMIDLKSNEFIDSLKMTCTPLIFSQFEIESVFENFWQTCGASSCT